MLSVGFSIVRFCLDDFIDEDFGYDDEDCEDPYFDLLPSTKSSIDSIYLRTSSSSDASEIVLVFSFFLPSDYTVFSLSSCYLC